MTKRNNYSYKYPPGDQKIIEKLSNPNYEGGNFIVPETASVEEKMKYSISQSILAYQQESLISFASLVKEIDIRGLTEKKLIDICRGKLTNFSLGELLIYANNLRITNIPCYQCGVNLFPPLFGDMLASLKEKEIFPSKSFCQTFAQHHHLV